MLNAQSCGCSQFQFANSSLESRLAFLVSLEQALVMSVGDQDPAIDQSSAQFNTTHWSVVLAAGQTVSAETSQALQTLCRAYWHPLYCYVRRAGHAPEDAQDLTQEFFARLLEKNYFALK
jgi:hypothetical protein